MKLSSGMVSRFAGDGQESTFRPQLTSLVDVMTILLVFLIKSFSVEGTLISPAADLTLPLSSAQTPPRSLLTIEVSRSSIIAQGVILQGTATVARQDSLTIEPLLQWLRLQRAAAADTSGRNEVLIQADGQIEFSVLKRVMYTCSKAGFGDFSVLVQQEE